jgi:DNA-binding PadR family transcriptional regulator
MLTGSWAYSRHMSQALDGYDEDSGSEELPATAYAVLGILTVNDEELSAGEIKTRASFGMRYFYWSPAVSHIRRELRRLLALGLVEEREITIGRVRRSQVYQTTQAGDEALVRWVTESSPDEPVVVKNSVLLRVFLGSKAPLGTVLSVLDSRMAQVDDSIAELNWGLRRGRELDLLGQERLRFTRAVGEYSLRALYFERGNLQQLRDTVAGFDTEGFREDTSRPRGPLRRRGSAGQG